jgi:hypothetical protein
MGRVYNQRLECRIIGAIEFREFLRGRVKWIGGQEFDNLEEY